MENFTQESTGILLNNNALANLNETRKWSMFMAILGYVFIGLFLFIALIVILLGLDQKASMAMIPLVLLSVIYFFPIHYLYKFSACTKDAIQNKSEESLAYAMYYQRRYYRFIGIMMIAVMAIYAIVIAYAAAFGSLLKSLMG